LKPFRRLWPVVGLAIVATGILFHVCSMYTVQCRKIAALVFNVVCLPRQIEHT